MVEQVASDIELLVIQWLERRNIEYQFSTGLGGGFFELGGAVVDFLFPDLGIAWRIMGEYYHTGVEKEGSDEIQREMLTNMGYIVVDIWGLDITERIDQTLTLALQGVEML